MVKLSKNSSTKIESTIPEGYKAVLENIVGLIKTSQTRALAAVNRELVEVYRDIGKTIHEQQQVAQWGTSVVEQLAKDLQNSFPGMRGFSSRNLWMMRDFYISCLENEKLQTLSAEISWSHNVAILSKCTDTLEREFYIRMSRRNGWSYRVLLNHICNKTFEKTISSQTNFDQNLPKKMRPEAKLAVKMNTRLVSLSLLKNIVNTNWRRLL